MNYFYATLTAKFDIYKLERQLHTYQLNTLNDMPKSKTVGFDSHSIEMTFNTEVPFFKLNRWVGIHFPTGAHGPLERETGELWFRV